MFARWIAVLGLLLLAACERPPQEPRVTVEDAVVTVPAVPGAPGAAYFRLTTNNDPTRLVSVASPSAGRIELHQSREENGVSRMVEMGQAQLTFDPDRPLEFAPGGNHAMLFDVDPNILPGTRVALTFTFEPAPPVTVEAEVRGPGQAHERH